MVFSTLTAARKGRAEAWGIPTGRFQRDLKLKALGFVFQVELSSTKKLSEGQARALIDAAYPNGFAGGVDNEFTQFINALLDQVIEDQYARPLL